MKVLEKNGQVIEGNFEEKEKTDSEDTSVIDTQAEVGSKEIISRYKMCNRTSNR